MVIPYTENHHITSATVFLQRKGVAEHITYPALTGTFTVFSVNKLHFKETTYQRPDLADLKHSKEFLTRYRTTSTITVSVACYNTVGECRVNNYFPRGAVILG